MAGRLRLHKGRISLILSRYLASIRKGGGRQQNSFFQKTISASTDLAISTTNNLSWRIGGILPGRGRLYFDWGLVIEEGEMLFLLAIFVVVCLLVYCMCRRVDADGFFDSMSHGGSHRTKKLYCETCRRNCDIDESGWCHECERITPPCISFLNM